MSLRRDGLGCLPLLVASGVLVAIATRLLDGPHEGLAHMLLVVAALLPFAYFISPSHPSESVIFSTGRAARFPRTVHRELGVSTPPPWWKPLRRRRPIPVLVGEDELDLRVSRLRFRKYPDVLLDLDLGPDFPRGLAASARGPLKRLSSQPLVVPGLDLELEGDRARLLALFDAPMRWQTKLHADRWRLVLADGHLRAEVHGLDLKERGIAQTREFLEFARQLRVAAAAPVSDRLVHNAKRDLTPALRIASAEALWDLEPRSERANQLRKAWLRRAHRVDLRIAAARRSGGEGLRILDALARGAAPFVDSEVEDRVAAVRALGDLAPDSLPTLQALAGLPVIAPAVAEQLARHGAGGELALAPAASSGDLALAPSAETGDLALAPSAGTGDLALAPAGARPSAPAPPGARPSARPPEGDAPPSDDQDSVSRGIKSTKLQGRNRESS